MAVRVNNRTAPRNRQTGNLVAPRSANRSRRPATNKRRQTYRRAPRAPRSWKGLKTAALVVLVLVVGVSLLGGFSILLIKGHDAVASLPFFHLAGDAAIQVEGNKRLSKATVLEMAQVQEGASLLAVSPRRVEKALLQHPWVKSAAVDRRWPNRLNIRVEEFEPLAVVHLDKMYFLSTDGIIFKALDADDHPDLPIITGLRPEHVQPWETQPGPLLSRVMELCHFLKGTGPPFHYENIAEIHVDSERGLSVYPNSLKVAVDLGFHGYAQKFANLQRVLPQMQQSGNLSRLQKINLNYPQRVLVSVKEHDPASP